MACRLCLPTPTIAHCSLPAPSPATVQCSKHITRPGCLAGLPPPQSLTSLPACPPSPHQVAPQGLTTLAQEAMTDISHYLRPSHLQQLQRAMADPEASSNDRFVIMQLLKNACVAAGQGAVAAVG